VTVARIDFTGVGCIDYSCADEIVAKLLRDRRAVVVLSGISDGHREAIEPVLAGHGLAALIERRDGGGGGELGARGGPEGGAARRRSSWAAAWAPSRYRTWPCCGRATTCWRASGFTAACSGCSRRNSGGSESTCRS